MQRVLLFERREVLSYVTPHEKEYREEDHSTIPIRFAGWAGKSDRGGCLCTPGRVDASVINCEHSYISFRATFEHGADWRLFAALGKEVKTYEITDQGIAFDNSIPRRPRRPACRVQVLCTLDRLGVVRHQCRAEWRLAVSLRRLDARYSERRTIS